MTIEFKALLRECAQLMGMREEDVIQQVFISVDGTIDYRAKLSEVGMLNTLYAARSVAIRRKERVATQGALPHNFYAGEW